MSCLLLPIASIAWGGCSAKIPTNSNVIRILMDAPPLTLNPRSTLDASGQRLNALMFRALTAIDPNLAPQADLAESWSSENQGKLWSFKIRAGLKDHSGEEITPERIAQCLEEYRLGIPRSALQASFPSWIKTNVKGSHVRVELSQPDPYLPRNLTLLRYFRVLGRSIESSICVEPPPNAQLIGSGRMKAEPFQLNPENQITLRPVDPSDRRALSLIFVRDETTRLLKLLQGDGDAIQNLTLTKARWLQIQHPDRFSILERDGVNVSYLAFNLKDPTLAKVSVRQAIAHAIDRDSIVRHKMYGFGTLAGSFVSPLLPESTQIGFKFDPALSEKLLDQAGYPRGKDGIRLRFKYKTTPVREGFETALLFKEMLFHVGIELELEVIEPAVFLSSIKNGSFQLYSSRWVGVADASILYRTLRSGQPNNRVGYVNDEMDRLLDLAMSETELAKRLPLVKSIQARMMQDLPYFPLWYWNNSLILSNRITGLEANELSLSGGLVPLTSLRVK